MKHSLDREEVGAVCMLDLEIDVGRKKKKMNRQKTFRVLLRYSNY